jgi:hypothetical protein
MKPSHRIHTVVFLGCLVWLSGCQGKPQEVSAGFGSLAYDRTVVTYGTWGEGTAILVWTDTEGVGGGGAASTPDGARYRGRVKYTNGEHLEWECTTADGKTGAVTLNGTSYDLAGGPLFLVTTRSGRTEARQIRRDLSHVQPSRESLDALARIDREVAKFLAAVEKP